MNDHDSAAASGDPGNGAQARERYLDVSPAGEYAVYLADDGTSIVEHAPDGTREGTAHASDATSSDERAREGARELILIVGANGAGKTTWGRAHRPWLPVPFYNVDAIAEGLGNADDPDLQREARSLVDQRIEAHLRTGQTLGFEST